MAKPSNKTAKPASKSTPAAPVTEAPASKKSRNAVLIKKTPSELRDLIGADTPIGVSLKELKNIITAATVAEKLADL